MIQLICALTENDAIGNEGKLLFYLPADLKHFKNLTTGNTIIMGRKTFESLPKGALPNRRNIVITHQKNYTAPGIEVFHSLESAFEACSSDKEVFIIGGESIYAAALPYAERLCLTHIHEVAEKADTFFPAYNPSDWILENQETHEPDEKNKYSYTFAYYKRK